MIVFHVISCSFMLVPLLSFSFSLFHVISFSLMLFHFRSCSFILGHPPPPSVAVVGGGEGDRSLGLVLRIMQVLMVGDHKPPQKLRKSH